jgi:hypothetical protein
MSESVDGLPEDEAPARPPYGAPGIAWEESLRSHADLMAACSKTEAEGFTCGTGTAS